MNQLASKATPQTVVTAKFELFLGSAKGAAAHPNILTDYRGSRTEPSVWLPLEGVSKLRDIPVVIAPVVKIEPDLSVDAKGAHQGCNIRSQCRQAKFPIDSPVGV